LAFRLSTQILHGEIDIRHPNRAVGILHIAGCKEPLTLDLVGNPWRDLAAHRILLKNPVPVGKAASAMAPKQTGRVGDITASRKVKVLDCPLEDLPVFHEQKRPATDHSDDEAQSRLEPEADSEAADQHPDFNNEDETPFE
jgi:hypothetical protein